MITKENIQQAYAAMQSDNDFPTLVAKLIQLNVTEFSFFVHDGSELFKDAEGNEVRLEAKFTEQTIAPQANAEQLYKDIKIHQQKETDFPTFLQQAAANGIAYWTVVFSENSCIYFDTQHSEVLREALPG